MAAVMIIILPEKEYHRETWAREANLADRGEKKDGKGTLYEKRQNTKRGERHRMNAITFFSVLLCS